MAPPNSGPSERLEAVGGGGGRYCEKSGWGEKRNGPPVDPASHSDASGKGGEWSRVGLIESDRVSLEPAQAGPTEPTETG